MRNPIDIVHEILATALSVPVTTPALEAIPTMGSIPQDRPARLVLVDLDGDASSEFLQRPRLALTCWGTTNREAHEIALSAVDALCEAAMDHDLLSAVELESISSEQWSRTGQGRYLVLLTAYINTD